MLFGAFSNFEACTLFINANLLFISFVKLMFMIQMNVNIFIQIVQHLVVVVSCPVHLGPVILLGCLRELNDLQMWLTFYKKFNGTKTFPSLNWCLWLKWMETFFFLIVQYLVVLRMAWKLSEIIPLLTQKLYCTSTMWH